MAKRYRTSKFIREYGVTLNQLAEKYDVSASYLRVLHEGGKLHDFIKEQKEKQKELVEAEK